MGWGLGVSRVYKGSAWFRVSVSSSRCWGSLLRVFYRPPSAVISEMAPLVWGSQVFLILGFGAQPAMSSMRASLGIPLRAGTSLNKGGARE